MADNVVPLRPGGGEPDRLPVPAPDRLPVPADVSYEVALDPVPGRALVPVDPPAPAEQWVPAVPEHLRTWAGIKTAMERHARRNLHRAAVHSLRSPRYLLYAVFWAVVGVYRMGGRHLGWVWVAHAVPLEFQAAKDRDGKEFRSIHKQLKDTRKVRLYVLAAEGLAVAAGIGVMDLLAPWWAWVLLAIVLLPLLARAGRPADKRIFHPAVITPRYRKLSQDVVLRAYYRAKLGDPVKPDEQVTFPGIMREEGQGCGVVVDLPYGKTLKDAMDAKDKIASGLDVTEQQVFIHRDPTSTRRHKLWVAYQDPLAVPVGKTPLLACRQTDIWKKAPLGLDERGQIVQFLMLWHSILAGGMPRQGKSWSARLLALFAALDPYVQMDVFDAAGKPDWRKFALVADSCAFGLTPTRDGKPPEILLQTLLRIKEDVETRYDRLSGLPTRICPEGKLTREIARDPQFRMPVRLLVLDEVQEFFLLGDISNQIAKLLVYLVKVAPGAGVIVLSATQRPSGIGQGYMGTQFVNFRDQHQIRFALKTPSWGVSDLVLGDGAYSTGLDSSKLLEEYKGVGILRNAMNTSPTVRCHHGNDSDAEKILLAARGLRERAGTLAGMALGEEVSAPARDVLGDVLAVFGADPGLHWQVLAARLRTQLPERWEDATADAISAQLRDLGVPVRQVKMFGQNLNGCRKADIEQLRGHD